MARPRHTTLAGKRAKDLRRTMTISEARVWKMIRGRKTGLRFRRQVPIGHWIADFASLDPKLVIEVDDPSHDWRDETSRTTHFESQGFDVIRFTNETVAKDPGSVLGTIEAWIADHAPLAGSAGTPPNVSR